MIFHFGTGTAKHTLILELYSKGNIILTDKDYRIVQLLRTHAYEKDQVKVQVGNVYPLTYATSAAQHGANESLSMELVTEESISHLAEWVCAFEEQKLKAERENNAPRKGKKNQSLNLKTLLLRPESGVSHFGPALLEHCILEAGIQANEPFQYTKMTDDEWKRLKTALKQEGTRVLKELYEKEGPGFILYRPREGSSTGPPDASNTDGPHEDKIFEEFQPHLLLQHRGKPHIIYDSFGAAVDDFFGQLLSQKNMQKAQSQENAIKEKLEKIKQDQKDRIQALEQEQEALQEQARAIELHADSVDKALAVINSALDSGMDWDQLEELVKVEKSNQNPIALLVQKLELEKESMLLRLPVDLLREGSDYLDVKVSLKETAFSNASNLFAKYRAMKEKEKKTIEASEKALKAAEETAKRQLTEARRKTKQVVSSAKRKPLWFEKFHWFITSENYLVLGGRDAHQNEQLVKRYLREGDAYLHADVHGASSCILRAKRQRLKDGLTKMVPLSQQALREAGNFTICLSKAWSSKMVTSAWWVEAGQVSKTAPSGEFLTVGSFMIRGKKNFLPPSSLELGLSVLFRLGDEDSILRHKQERRDFGLIQLEEEEKSQGENLIINQESGEIAFVSDSTDVNSIEVNEQNQRDGTDGYDTSEVKCENGAHYADSQQSNGKTREGKKGLSIKEKKLIKKYGSLEAASDIQLANERAENRNETRRGKTSTMSQQSDQSTKRGKKTKMKRAMKKYQDQDDEDKELAMMALHGGEKHKKKSKDQRQRERTTEKAQEAADQTIALLKGTSNEIIEQLPETVKLKLMECIRKFTGTEIVDWEVLHRETTEHLISLKNSTGQERAVDRLMELLEDTKVDDLSSSLGGIIRTISKFGYEDILKNKDGKSEKADATMVDEKEEEEEEKDEDEIDDTEVLNKLTGKPLGEDLVLFAVPVLAPYQTVSQYSYRVKLTPGSLKRGKAAKQCLEMLSRPPGKAGANEDRNIQMIKRVDDNDWIQALVGDVKISAPGASKVTKKGKANGKKSK